jgi:hypothetical protein
MSLFAVTFSFYDSASWSSAETRETFYTYASSEEDARKNALHNVLTNHERKSTFIHNLLSQRSNDLLKTFFSLENVYSLFENVYNSDRITHTDICHRCELQKDDELKCGWCHSTKKIVLCKFPEKINAYEGGWERFSKLLEQYHQHLNWDITKCTNILQCYDDSDKTYNRNIEEFLIYVIATHFEIFCETLKPEIVQICPNTWITEYNGHAE